MMDEEDLQVPIWSYRVFSNRIGQQPVIDQPVYRSEPLVRAS
jgi:hypothetical protein